MLKSGYFVNQIAEMICAKNILSGGSKELSQKTNVTMVAFLIALFLILIKGFIVYLSYNMLMPKLIYSLNGSKKSYLEIENDFRPLTYWESVIFVILTNTLF